MLVEENEVYEHTLDLSVQPPITIAPSPGMSILTAPSPGMSILTNIQIGCPKAISKCEAILVLEGCHRPLVPKSVVYVYIETLPTCTRSQRSGSALDL